ncbi:MAG: DUF5777 family beta-barrel protein [Vicinamibacterales bacterium]
MLGRKAVWGASVVLALFVCTAPAEAQDQPPPSPRAVNLAQPDFTIVSLPTTLRMPRMKSAFRVTHRFGRPLGQGDFGDLASDFFGFDSGALIGLEFRFGVWDGVQIGVHRTSDRTIQLFGQGNVWRQGEERPIGIDAIVTAEGRENFSEDFGAAFGAAISRELPGRGAVYVEPIFVLNAATLGGAPDPVEEHTFFIGLGARVRLWSSPWYVVGEWAPRVSGYEPGIDHGGFAIERRAGGHSFQVNFSTSFATTYSQIARGGFNGDDWFIGFNISRKFF